MFALLLSFGILFQAANVNNPTAVVFTPSIDHAIVTSYELEILRPDNTVLQTLNLGKPAPNASNECIVALNVQPIAFGSGYKVRLRAKNGNEASDWIVAPMTFTKTLGAPLTVIIR